MNQYLKTLRLIKLAKEHLVKGRWRDALHCLEILETRVKKTTPTYLSKG